MGFEVWIIIVLAASVLSGWIGYAAARKGAPKQSELDAMAAELDEARQQAKSVQANVSEHFEQSALLFGKLAADYREFLDHFSTSAQNLGLSEARARELIEQGFQPLLTHEAVEEAVVAEAPADEGATAEDEALSSRISNVTVEMPDEAGGAAEEEIQAEARETAEAAAEEVAEAVAEETERQEVLAEAAEAEAAEAQKQDAALEQEQKRTA